MTPSTSSELSSICIVDSTEPFIVPNSLNVTDQLRITSRKTLGDRNILTRIMHHLPICDILTVSQLSRQQRLLATYYPHNRVTAEIGYWMTGPTNFLAHMDYCDAVVGGRTIPWLLVGIGRRPNILSLFVGGQGVQSSWMATYLRDKERYEIVFDVNAHPGPPMPVARSIVFRKRTVHPDRPFIHIHLIESTTRSSLHPILQSSSTASMNYLTGQRIYCLYPRLLIDKIGLLHPRCSRSAPAAEFLSDSLAQAGMTTYDSVERIPFPCRELCPTLWRSSADTAVLCVKHGTKPYSISVVDLFSFTWTLTLEGDMPEVRCPNPRCLRSNLMLRRRDNNEPECPYGVDLLTPQNLTIIGGQ